MRAHGGSVQMDELMKRIGAVPLDWGMKTECCGASFQLRERILPENCAGIFWKMPSFAAPGGYR